MVISMDKVEQIDEKNAKEVIDAVIDGQRRSLYFLKYKVKKRVAANAADSVNVLNWAPVSRPMVLTPEEFEYLTVGMKDDKIPQALITQLLLPGPGLIMSEVSVEKAHAG